jgi:hypothetical protein
MGPPAWTTQPIGLFVHESPFEWSSARITSFNEHWYEVYWIDNVGVMINIEMYIAIIQLLGSLECQTDWWLSWRETVNCSSG